MFTLNRINAKIAKLDLRIGKNRAEDGATCKIRIEVTTSNDFLSQLSPTLKWSFYDKPAEADLAADANHAPLLRYAAIDSIPWDGQIVGADLTFHAPVSKNDIEVKADIFDLTLQPKDGGTVIARFTAKCSPKPNEVGALSRLLGLEAEISMEPPEAITETDGEGDAASQVPGGKRNGKGAQAPATH